ncbi:hypothetical protein RIF29_13263 [Crotalaria pallida]|uniref:Uncharacterized protein n=1 Tax=Crotalaria pallida TaxID=3830 RepID=A0AAN9P1W4_CROPI
MESPLLMIKESTSEPDYLPVKSFKDAKHSLSFSSSSIYAGHVGDIELSSISVFQGVIASICFHLLYGMSIALVTLCGQAYGAGQIEHTGIYVQRSWIVLTATCIIILPLHIYATPILEFLGQDKDIADLAGTYSIKVIPNMFSLAIRHPIMRFLEAQSKVKVITFISFLALLLENVLFYIFIYVFGWGTTGLAMANNLTGWVVAVALVVHTVGWCKEGWRGLSWLAFKDLWAFTRLSLASSVMNCLQNLNVTCIILLAGQLDNPVIVVGSYSIW